MTYLLLSKDATLYSVRRFMQAARAMRVPLQYVNPLELSISQGRGGFTLLHKGRPLPRLSGVINRFGPRGLAFGRLVSHFCAVAGIPVINPFTSLIYSKNKFHTLCRARALSIPVPDTCIPAFAGDLHNPRALQIPPPYVVKVMVGTQGIGVVKAGDLQALQSVADYLWARAELFMIQHLYQADEIQADVRLLFLGPQCLGGVQKQPSTQDFRGNFHRGSTFSRFMPGAQMEKQARRLVEDAGVLFAAVDFLLLKNGEALLLELNDSPGFEGFESCHGRFVAEKVLEFLLAGKAGLAPG